MSIKFGIVGLGIAGSLLALELEDAGFDVTVIDDNNSSSATRIAAGLMNPILGPKLTLSPLFPTHWAQSIARYRHLEHRFKTKFLTEIPLQRLLSQSELDLWQHKKDLPAFSGWIENTPDISPVWNASFGAIEYRSFQLNTHVFLNSVREWYANTNKRIDQTFLHSDCSVLKNRIQWKDWNFDAVVFCEGARGAENPWLKSIEFRPAKGEILTVQCARYRDSKIVNWGKWLIPVEGATYKLGASAYWNWPDLKPNPHQIDSLVNSLRSRFNDEFTVEKIESGIRPSTRNRNPVFGFSPETTGIGTINGLGGTGILYGPIIANQFVENWIKQPNFAFRRLNFTDHVIG